MQARTVKVCTRQLASGVGSAEVWVGLASGNSARMGCTSTSAGKAHSRSPLRTLALATSQLACAIQAAACERVDGRSCWKLSSTVQIGQESCRGRLGRGGPPCKALP